MESYTKGLAREIVDSRGEHGALDAWGSLKDRAESIREEHHQHYILKAYNPKTSVAAKNLETAIAAWEVDVRSFQDATGEKFPETNRKLLLINMCPEKLRESLRAMERSRVSSYELIKREILDWLMEERARVKLEVVPLRWARRALKASTRRKLLMWIGTPKKTICPMASSWPL